MSDQLHELEGLRGRFLDQLHATRLDLAGHEAVLAYWQLVERQAESSGDLDLLERSVRELARDRDRLSALEARVAHEDRGSGLLQPMLQVIHAMMEVLARVARKLGRLRDQRRGQLAAILWLAGPGALANQRPDEKDEEKQKEEAQLQAALLAQRGPGQPTVQTPPEQQKKLER